MLHWSPLTPAHSLPVPEDLQGTRQALFFLLRRAEPAAQAPRPAVRLEADSFVFRS